MGCHIGGIGDNGFVNAFMYYEPRPRITLTGVTVAGSRAIGRKTRSASGDPARDDFQEFAWITKGNFQGRKKIAGRDWLIFRDNMPALNLTNPRLYSNLKSVDPGNAQVTTNVPVTATVEAVTKLPVSLQIGDELHVFSFLPAGTEMLVMPDAFALAAKQTVAEYWAKHKTHLLP